MTSAPAVQAAVQINLGDIGGVLNGIVAILAILSVVIWGPSLFKELRARWAQQSAQAAEQEKAARRERHRILHGWKYRGMNVYGVDLVTDPAEMRRGVEELAGTVPSAFVMLRIAEGGSGVGRADELRRLIVAEGYLTRPPTDGEREAIDRAAQQLILEDEVEYGREPPGANVAWWRRPRNAARTQ